MISSVGSANPTTVDYSTRTNQFFSKADTNGDGVISKDEFTAMFSQRASSTHHHHGGGGHADPSQAAATLLKAADADGNGSLSKTELQTLAGDRLSSSQLDAFIDSADQDKDGNLSASELEAAIRSAQDAQSLQYAARYVTASSDTQPPASTYSAQA